ncbi:hypothetical protein [Amycolatopsis samaneae]|uniref:Uncharacterized protein n=1 Tax=Amycolatopsis samaneae TaxID=664691 RepID=A0ABW5GW86_9PSEU
MARVSRRLALAAAVAVLLAATATPALAAEGWRQTGVQRYYLFDALQRSQGVATDGGSWFFSWQYGLSHVSLDGRTLAANNPAIPAEISRQGGNHIGDIDFHDGKLYVPIEDGPGYRHPYLALYDARTLEFTGTAYALPQALHTKGVPWVAVDAGRGYVYTAEWDPTAALNVFRLADLSLVKTVPLNPAIGRIQGAKLHDGALYASSDNATKSVYRVDPDSGSVTEVLRRDLGGAEAEGLAFLATPDGGVMHVLEAAPKTLSTALRGYVRLP